MAGRGAPHPAVTSFLAGAAQPLEPLFLHGDAAGLLARFPDALRGLLPHEPALLRPPALRRRRHRRRRALAGLRGGLGAVTAELRRVLKPTGSLWLNLGDTYRAKRQLGIPWRVAFHLADDQGWTQRNSVVWHKVKGGPEASRDKLRNVHELLVPLRRAAPRLLLRRRRRAPCAARGARTRTAPSFPQRA